LSDYSVYPRKDSPFWWIAFLCPRKGIRVCESSKQRRDEKLGFKRALDLAREKSEDGRVAKAELGVAAWELWVPAWLTLKYSDRPRTFAAEKHRWRFLHAFLTERKVWVPSEVTYQLGLDFLAWRQQHKTRSGKGGYNNALGELRMLGRIMRESVRRGFVKASPLERMGLKRHKSPEKPEITEDEIAAILNALKEKEGGLPITQRWMTVSFTIALHQGCRLQETSLPLGMIDERAGTVTFHQKGDRIFTTRLHDGLRPLVAELRAAKAKRTCVLPRMASKEWHWFLKGRPERNHVGVAPRICFHCTRVTVITRLARAGVPIQQAMRYVGHADETIHRIYQRLQTPDLDRCLAALSFGASETRRNPGGG
jgi:integrase